MSPKYKLIYFDTRGRAEPARMMFAHKGIQYEDKRVSHDGDDWKELKPKMPMGQLPAMYIDDTLICQSSAIFRAVARECGLLGNTPIEMAQADMIEGCVTDGMMAMMGWFMAPDENKAKVMAEIKETKLKPWGEKMAALLQAAGGQWFVKNTLTYADFVVACVVDMMTDGKRKGSPIGCGDVLPKALHEHRARVEALPGVKEWIEKRPKTDM